MNQAVAKRSESGTAMAGPQDRDQLIGVLQQSLYAGCGRDTVEMIIGYCEASGLDPMQKPVHAVPMNVKNPQSGQYEWRDVVMPGIGLYRIQAARSGDHAGTSEPEFGPERTETFRDKNGNEITVTFPDWCRVTVRKMVAGQVVEFVAREYWLENYATDSNKSTAPNAMWRKRPRGQLAKCTEAQALRKGWPEIGAAPTAEEMEGKSMESEPRDVTPQQSRPTEPAALPHYPNDRFEQNLPKWQKAMEQGKRSADDIIAMVSSEYQLTDEQIQQVRQAEPVAEQEE